MILVEDGPVVGLLDQEALTIMDEKTVTVEEEAVTVEVEAVTTVEEAATVEVVVVNTKP